LGALALRPLIDITIIVVIPYGRMKSSEAVDALGALAHAHRLAIYRLLVEQGPEGLPAGLIGERVGLQPSSLTFHLQTLQRAGLISQMRASRQLIYSADFAAMNGLVGFLTDKCCTASAPSCEVECKPQPVRKPARRSRAA
jgi:ArsR family transcriptional regulator, arsenate/arsenite/antimonite-responsive transcriptional repressor